ncbi:MAG: hypothetical protein KDK48_02125, partial [Chlamydiia bacterium]|nr:hypothetical protein [Chlamydiia bacterium]
EEAFRHPTTLGQVDMTIPEGGSLAFDYNINEFGSTPIRVHSEYTHQDILNLWGNPTDGFFSVVQEVFLKQAQIVRDGDGNIINVIAPTLSAADAEKLANALDKILAVAKDGLVIDGKRYYLTYQMAKSLDKIVNTLKATGFDLNLKSLDWSVIGGVLTSVGVGPPASFAPNVDALRLWVDLDDVGLRQIIIDAGQAISSARSLQAMVELEYVKVGNELIGSNMEKLEAALSSTKAALEALERAQRLKNQLSPDDVKAKASYRAQIFTASLKDGGSFGKQWIKMANELGFADGRAWAIGINDPNHPLYAFDPQLGFEFNDASLATFDIGGYVGSGGGCNASVTTGDFTAFFKNRLARVFATLIRTEMVINDNNLSEFQGVRSDLESALAQLEAAGVDPDEEGSIAARIRTVLENMNAGGGGDGTKMQQWVLDFYNETDFVKSGEYQRELTAAITAAESLNDQQKEDLRRFMFVFEQFYKSAAAMLQAMTQIISKMAQNIAR